MSSGDGWVFCAAGHRHWGRFGAAGLLILDHDRAVLQHRAPWTHDGDTFGVPGGARDSHEDPIAAAVREANEEAGLTREDVDPLGVYIDDHGGWSYSTVVAAPARPVEPRAANAESVSVSWHRSAEVDQLPLHRGFAASWPVLRHRPPRLVLELDQGLTADPDLARLIAAGIPVGALPSPPRPISVHRLYPHLSPEIDADGATGTDDWVVRLSDLVPPHETDRRPR